MTLKHLVGLPEAEVRYFVNRDIDSGEIGAVPHRGEVRIPNGIPQSIRELTAEGRRTLQRDGMVVGPAYFARMGSSMKVGQLADIADLLVEPGGALVIQPRREYETEILRVTLPTVWHLLYGWDGDPEFLYP